MWQLLSKQSAQGWVFSSRFECSGTALHLTGWVSSAVPWTCLAYQFPLLSPFSAQGQNLLLCSNKKCSLKRFLTYVWCLLLLDLVFYKRNSFLWYSGWTSSDFFRDLTLLTSLGKHMGAQWRAGCSQTTMEIFPNPESQFNNMQHIYWWSEKPKPSCVSWPSLWNLSCHEGAWGVI